MFNANYVDTTQLEKPSAKITYSNKKSNKVFFPNLDAIRTIAFMLVFLSHCVWPGIKYFHLDDTSKMILKSVIGNGKAGVSIFFVLSGYLITYLILSEIGVQKKLDLKAFYIRRTLRIWPLYLFYLLLAVTLYPYFKSDFSVDCYNSLSYYLYLSNFDIIRVIKSCPGNGLDMILLGITWSIAVEEQFYLAWPFLFLLARNRNLAYVVVLIIFASILFRFVYAGDETILELHTFSVVCLLALGGMAAYLSYTSKETIRRFVESKLSVFAYILGSALFLFQFVLFSGENMFVLKPLILGSFYAFIIVDQNFNSKSRFKLKRFKLLDFWGKYTYGLYLLHVIALLICLRTFAYLNFEITTFYHQIVYAVFALVVSCVLSYFSYNYFEKYFLRLKKKFAYITKN